MTPDDARDQQHALATGPGNVFVHACPGAGKTRTVVNRFIELSKHQSNPTTGLAVISFTNRAADEVAARCSSLNQPQLAAFPNFIGTFDRFISTFIVRPFGTLAGPIKIVDSWDSIDIEIAGRGGPPVSLDRFIEISPDGVLRFEPGPTDPRLTPSHARAREHAARSRRNDLRREGYITCDDARSYASQLLADHPRIAELIVRRFGEIIVDEAQDCSRAEIDILEHLRAADATLTMICDPNQAIYEWRGAEPQRLKRFTANLDQHHLVGNWRSTPAICQLASTFRQGPPDQPVGERRSSQTPVLILQYNGRPSAAIATTFAAHVEATGLAVHDALVLAHAQRMAATACGAPTSSPTNNVARLARGTAQLVEPTTSPRERKRAFDRLQRLVLSYLDADPTGLLTPDACDIHDIDPDWLRRTTLRLVHWVRSQDHATPIEDWIAAARRAFTDIAASTPRPARQPGHFVRMPRGAAGKTIGDTVNLHQPGRILRHSTIHDAKGTEAPAVLVVIPPDRKPNTRSADLLQTWAARSQTEPLRVLYVGITRAEQLCAIAIPATFTDAIQDILKTNHVVHEMRTVDLE